MSRLRDYLRTVIFDQNKKHNQWYELLPDIEKALNEVEHGTTLEVPSEVITGEPLTDEVAILLGLTPREVDREKTKDEINRRLQKANSRTIIQDIRRIFIGDYVRIALRRFSNKQKKIMAKFLPKFSGKFEVLKITSENRFKLRSVDDPNFITYQNRRLLNRCPDAGQPNPMQKRFSDSNVCGKRSCIRREWQPKAGRKSFQANTSASYRRSSSCEHGSQTATN